MPNRAKRLHLGRSLRRPFADQTSRQHHDDYARSRHPYLPSLALPTLLQGNHALSARLLQDAPPPLCRGAAARVGEILNGILDDDGRLDLELVVPPTAERNGDDLLVLLGSRQIYLKRNTPLPRPCRRLLEVELQLHVGLRVVRKADLPIGPRGSQRVAEVYTASTSTTAPLRCFSLTRRPCSPTMDWDVHNLSVTIRIDHDCALSVTPPPPPMSCVSKVCDCTAALAHVLRHPRQPVAQRRIKHTTPNELIASSKRQCSRHGGNDFASVQHRRQPSKPWATTLASWKPKPTSAPHRCPR